jgi:hypothetical protein
MTDANLFVKSPSRSLAKHAIRLRTARSLGAGKQITILFSYD